MWAHKYEHHEIQIGEVITAIGSHNTAVCFGSCAIEHNFIPILTRWKSKDQEESIDEGCEVLELTNDISF